MPLAAPVGPPPTMPLNGGATHRTQRPLWSPLLHHSPSPPHGSNCPADHTLMMTPWPKLHSLTNGLATKLPHSQPAPCIRTADEISSVQRFRNACHAALTETTRNCRVRRDCRLPRRAYPVDEHRAWSLGAFLRPRVRSGRPSPAANAGEPRMKSMRMPCSEPQLQSQ